ncbi:penicillin-binding protein [Cerasibacillus quisquiliarum]|uniref:serine-type D-Ala-D-Ala carboxypeptidase n=1 Tax=Cerasibacillus quisquiliarum TaxID=227865 RepID=A0A511UVI3_9BACI|nr:penicillin-binding transpeptidase domain-containing protein [Cerasibacillus quisquiliarum]MBB5145179.1 penicillin-binding protein [Cerasibacillus quisquiliarum]GEN29931.1 penicillin-binding protein 3 [Cerasibacillus quisquiliarum]
MKRALLIFVLLAIAMMSACSDNNISSPNDRFDEYVSAWEKQQFDKMYAMLTSESKSTYPTEQFIDRYQKIYQDLQITDPKITFKKLGKKDLKKAKKDGKITIPFQVELNSVAGPITFNYNASFIQEVVDKEKSKKDWFLKWDPGFIFPDIKDGSEIGLEIVEPARGEILDRNKMPLALNGIMVEIGIIPKNLGPHAEENKQRLANLLNMSVEMIDKLLDQNWVQPEYFVPIKKVSVENEALINQALMIEGVTKRDVTGRIYPGGKATAHLVGYISQATREELEKLDKSRYRPGDMIGKSGLEKLFEDRLKGERGAKIFVKKGETEKKVIAEKPVKDGENISITIDINLQERIYNSYNGAAGTAAAIHPKTGETLALVSSPAYDPNEMVYGISQEKWDALQNDPNKPLLNRFAATYAPGSVIKPITAAIGIKNGTLKPEEGLTINGQTWSNGKGWGDYKVRRVSTTNAPVDLDDALVRSDNIYFAMQAVRMGSKAYVKGLKEFGVGEKFPYTYPIQDSTISTSGDIDHEVLLANTSYGQGEIEFSSLHLATAYSAFLNEGDIIQPTLLLSEETGQVWKENVLAKEDVKFIQDGLRHVVTKGTARAINNAKVDISGKTGTAELKVSADQKGDENSWFIGYPTKSQDFIIAMMMEKTQTKERGIVTKNVAEIIEYVNKKIKSHE